MAYPNYNKRFTHDVVLENDGIFDTTLAWTEKNCKYSWAWGHNDGKGYFSFSCPKEALVFRIQWVDYYARL